MRKTLIQYFLCYLRVSTFYDNCIFSNTDLKESLQIQFLQKMVSEIVLCVRYGGVILQKTLDCQIILKDCLKTRIQDSSEHQRWNTLQYCCKALFVICLQESWICLSKTLDEHNELVLEHKQLKQQNYFNDFIVKFEKFNKFKTRHLCRLFLFIKLVNCFERIN